MTWLKARQATSKINITLGLILVTTMMLGVTKVIAHTNHPHTQDAKDSVTENSDSEEEATATTPIKKDTGAELHKSQRQEAQSQPVTTLPVTTAEVSGSASVPLGEILLGLIVAVPPLLISSRKRLHSK